MKNSSGYNKFRDFVQSKRISLIGLGVSNLPLIRFFLDSGAQSVSVRDLKKTQDSPEVIEALKQGANVILGKDYLDGLCEDIILRSPGIRPDIPELCSARDSGSLITCETELFLHFSACKRIAVTGSDGKTTTTTLISKILEQAGYTVILGGNIGKSMLPRLSLADQDNAVAVMELSSFQLMNCNYSPDISVITNLAENHLDWHKDMNEYLVAKKNILNHQSASGIGVLNWDNEHTRNCALQGQGRFFTYFADRVNEIPSQYDVIFYEDNKIKIRTGKKIDILLERSSILLPGKHNVENYMAAIGATIELAQPKDILAVATTFGGVEHRIELVRELDGVKYYNSSIDSSPSRSTAALRSFSEKVIMIAGGYDKNLDYSSLGDEICSHVKFLILCGKTSEKIENATRTSALYQNEMPQIIRCERFEETVKIARENAKKGDAVILSPASASFDLFKNFEERGKYFKQLVMELK